MLCSDEPTYAVACSSNHAVPDSPRTGALRGDRPLKRRSER
jgi:hypothetical protein